MTEGKQRCRAKAPTIDCIYILGLKNFYLKKYKKYYIIFIEKKIIQFRSIVGLMRQTDNLEIVGPNPTGTTIIKNITDVDSW